MKKIFSLFFLLACSGLFISVACNNNSYFAPTKPDNPSLGTSPTPTPTNLNGYTSTPTPTWTPTFTPTLTPIPTPMNTVTVPLCAVNVPNGLAIGNSSIYVAGGDGNLSIFSTAGASVTVFNNIGTTIIFGNLYGVAVDTTIGNSNSGCYYVLDYGNNTVYEFTSSNAPVTSWNNYNGVNFNQPEGIGVDPSGNVYVVDTGNNEIEVFSAGGSSAVTEWGGLGSGNGMFDNPTGAAFNGSTIYISDASNHLIQEFNSGTYAYSGVVTTVASSDVDGISVDGSGNIYAADYAVNSGNGQVEEYSSSGILMAQWNGLGGVSLFGPDGVVYSGGNLYVADYDNNAIDEVTP